MQSPVYRSKKVILGRILLMETAMRSLAEIDAEIASTKEALNNVHGTETEVYARIVGYYRAVRNWNKGKRDEFDHRKMFSIADSKEYSITEADNHDCGCKMENVAPATKAATIVSNTTAGAPAASYEMFVRSTCPNCPPVKQYMAGVSLAGKAIDVDTDAGLQLAAAKGVFATPTVIVYDQMGSEIGRAHTTTELDEILVPAKAAVLA